jgi:hypothetical protein
MNRRHAYVPRSYSRTITGTLLEAGLLYEEEVGTFDAYLQTHYTHNTEPEVL